MTEHSPDQPLTTAPSWTPPQRPEGTEGTSPAAQAGAAGGAAGGGGGGKSMVTVAGEDDHEAYAKSRGWKYFDLDAEGANIPEETRTAMEPELVRELGAVPVALLPNRVAVAVADPDDLAKATKLRPRFPGRVVRLVYANPTAIRRHTDRYYSAVAESEKIGESTSVARVKRTSQILEGGGNVGRLGGGESANVSMMRLIIEQALQEKASDIHIEPTETHLEVRYRVDGKLHVVGRYPSGATEGLMTYIKVSSKMRSDNFLVPDSGVMYYEPRNGAKTVDIRVETAPTSWGTSAVMRLQAEIWRELSTLGFSARNEDRFRRAISQPYGIILATGPTGSGKSTTLYSALREKIDPEIKIITLENPVEYKIAAGVSQMSVNVEQEMTFAKGLRSILRQDPDVVLVGEIRDEETAETAVDAAMTGHLVFSTLHTNDAPGVVPRLIRMGIEPFMVASSLVCVVGQRLVRRLCPHCKIAVDEVADHLLRAGFTPPDATLPEAMFEANPEGCEHCTSGFSGRVPIHEVMTIDPKLGQAISDNAAFTVISEAAADAGMLTLREDGLGKALDGVTSLREVNANTRQQIE